MNYKKFSVITVLALLMLSVSLSLVVAQSGEEVAQTAEEVGEEVESFLKSVSAFVNPILKWVIGDASFENAQGEKEVNEEEFIARILAFFLAVVIIYGLLDKTKLLESGKLNFLLGLIVAVIGIRFMPTGLLGTLAAPSSALIAGLFVGIPFLLIAVATSNLSDRLRKAIWAIYGAVLLFIVVNAYWASKNWFLKHL